MRLAGGIRQDDQRKFQSLGFVDAHQAYGALGVGGGFSLTRPHIAQRLQVFEEAAHIDKTAGLGVGQQFIQVAPQAACHAAGMGGGQDGAIIDRIDQLFEQFGDRQAVDEGLQVGENVPGAARQGLLGGG